MQRVLDITKNLEHRRNFNNRVEGTGANEGAAMTSISSTAPNASASGASLVHGRAQTDVVTRLQTSGSSASPSIKKGLENADLIAACKAALTSVSTAIDLLVQPAEQEAGKAGVLEAKPQRKEQLFHTSRKGKEPQRNGERKTLSSRPHPSPSFPRRPSVLSTFLSSIWTSSLYVIPPSLLT
jgi:hypothetical protein